MAEAKAHLKSYRQSPRKVRLVANAIRGKRAEEALTILTFIPKRAGLPLKKLVASALANAKSLQIPAENLFVKSVSVDKGQTMYRRRPRSHGMANPIRKRMSHVSVTLAEKEAKAPSRKATAAQGK